MAGRELTVTGKGYQIRPATPADVTSLATLARTTYAEAFGSSMSNADLAAHLDQHLCDDAVAGWVRDDLVLVAARARRLLGFAHVGRGPDRCVLERLYVEGSARNRGLGTALMDAVLADPAVAAVPVVDLDVWARNLDAQRFYGRFGFVLTGDRRAFELASGAPAEADLIMRRDQRG